MTFPSFVPEAVRASITARLDGDAWEPMGYRKALENAEAALKNLQTDPVEQRAPTHLADLRAAQAHREGLAAEVALLERLGSDPRMEPAYAALKTQSGTASDSATFITCAWVAARNFKNVRENAERARSLESGIGKAAENLSKKLRALEPLAHLTSGDLFAPGVAEAVDQIQRAAAAPSAEQPRYVASALSSRKESPGPAYVRALATLLEEKGMGHLALANAIAPTANVALNLGRQHAMTQKAARSALAQMKRFEG